MNYKKIYDSIIARAKKRTLPKNRYVEVHHIIPKSFFESIKLANQKNNLVELLPEEHWICHLLLAKFSEGKEKEKMLQAVLVMSGAKRNKLKCTNKRYAKRKKSSAYRKRKKKDKFYIRKKNRKRKVTHKFDNKKFIKSSKVIKINNKIKKTKNKKSKIGGRKMILISGQSCGICKMAKNMLNKKNLKYIEYDYNEAESKEYIEMAKPCTALPFLFDKNVCYCGMDAIKHIKEK